MTAPTCSTARCTPTRPPTIHISPATPTRPARGPAKAPTSICRCRSAPTMLRSSRPTRGLGEAVKRHGSEALILSAGWDAHRDDPLSKLPCYTDAYARIGELYGKLGLPTLIVQEGGYSLEAVAAASHAFTQAFREAHGNVIPSSRRLVRDRDPEWQAPAQADGSIPGTRLRDDNISSTANPICVSGRASARPSPRA